MRWPDMRKERGEWEDALEASPNNKRKKAGSFWVVRQAKEGSCELKSSSSSQHVPSTAGEMVPGMQRPHMWGMRACPADYIPNIPWKGCSCTSHLLQLVISHIKMQWMQRSPSTGHDGPLCLLRS